MRDEDMKRTSTAAPMRPNRSGSKNCHSM